MLARSRRKSAPVLRLESLEDRLAPAGFFLFFETQVTINLFANTFQPAQFANNFRVSYTPPNSTPSVQPPTFSLGDSLRLIVSDLVASLNNSIAPAASSTPDASSAASSGAAASGSSSAASGISAALRGNGALVTNVVVSTAAADASRFFDAFGLLRALPQAATAVPVNTVRPLITNTLSDSLALALPTNSTGLKRLEPGRISFGDLFEDPAANKAGEMGRLPKQDAQPDRPIPQPDNTNPDKGDQNKPATPDFKQELPEETQPPEQETADEVLSMTWVDPSDDASEAQPVAGVGESLRNYAATMTVALALNGWWNRSPSVAGEKERRRMAMRLRD
jgi:hypothetical protein